MAADKTSKSQEKRKSSKPLMEKRRRARINECLNKLQAILEVVNGHAEPQGGHSKREKAEILEQTVQLVKHLRHQEQGGHSRESVPHAQYRAGFNECLNEVSRFMEANDCALNAETQSGLLNHLASTMMTTTATCVGGGAAATCVGGGGAATCVGGGAAISGWTRQIGQSLSKSLSEERVVNRGMPVVDRRGCTAVQPVNPLPPHISITPSQVSAASTTPSVTSPISTPNDTTQHSLRKGDPPKACAPSLATASTGVALPINFQSAQVPAGHIAVVLPAHLLGSFVGGQFAAGQLIPLYYQQQGCAPIACQRVSTLGSVTIPPGSSAMVVPTPGHDPNHGDHHGNTCSNVRAGQVFIAPSPVSGCSPKMAPINARTETSSSAERRVPVSNPPATHPGMETKDKPTCNGTPHNGIIYAPASLPMQFYVAPSIAYGGGGDGRFTNGLALGRPPTLALDTTGAHWRPWGLEQNQR